ncbi:ABC transporter permease [Conexibacter sp. CPCC 206217]|uniref:ABC transporter permease n=1 Tax=Conexibacter sp. CPCC 206217 TaxID=3064574 RepID=UPI0027290513|nr:ABC transporter permease [Conexibacter sp. CPCC 206217]MDO8210618.1 ABC transporter permease [Conexibacter sp. CPCC 206217]
MSTLDTTQTNGRTAAEHEALRKALQSGPRPPRASAFAHCRAFGWRGLLKIRHVPEQLIDATLTPVLFTVMFTFMFGGAIAGSTSEYLQFILPGLMVQSVLFTTVYSGVALNTDMTRGVVDRFRSLPLWRPAPLVGAVIGDSARYLIAGSVVVVVGLILGFRPDGGVPGVLLGILLVLLFAFGLAWVFMTVGLLMRAPNAVMNTGFMALFPLVFLSNIFVDPNTLPSVLETIVQINPVTHLVTAVRGLMQDDAALDDIALVLGEAAVLTLVFVPLTTRLYRKAG